MTFTRSDLAVLIDTETLQRRISELAAEISRDYADKELALIGILKGSFVFLADLSRRMQWDAQQATDPEADFVREHIAAGTLGALVWLLDITDVAPATGRILRDRSPAAIM